MATLAGSFHFAGYEEELLAGKMAEQLNVLNRDGLYPDMEWTAQRDGTGNLVLCARAEDAINARAAGSILKSMGVLSDYCIFAAVEENNPGQNPAYYVIVTGLYHANRERLDQMVDLEDGPVADCDDTYRTAAGKLILN